MYDRIYQYVMKNGGATIPEVQVEFSIGYGSARGVFAKLVENKVVTLVDGLYYQLIDDKKTQTAESETPVQKTEQKNEQKTDQKPSEETAKKEQADKKQTSSAKVDSGETTSKSSQNKKAEETSSNAGQSTPISDAKKSKPTEKDDKEGKDGEKKSAFSFYGTNNDEFVRRNAIAKTVTCFLRSARFSGAKDEYTCDLGVEYPDKSKMQFRLFYKDGVCLSDGGKTIAYLNKKLGSHDNILFHKIDKILSKYGLVVENIDGKSQVIIRVEEEEKIFKYFLTLFNCVSALNEI